VTSRASVALPTNLVFYAIQWPKAMIFVVPSVGAGRDPRCESANPDSEILSALRLAGRALARDLGALRETRADREHFGKNSDRLVWRAPSLVMNPTLDGGARLGNLHWFAKARAKG